MSPAPPPDPCGAAVATLEPVLGEHRSLFVAWGLPPEGVEDMALPVAPGTLDRVPPRLPVVKMRGDTIELLGQRGSASAIRSRLLGLRAKEIVLAAEGTTPWPAVVRLVHELPAGMRVHVAFALDTRAPRLGDPAAVLNLRAGGAAAFRELARDMTQRCPAVGDLFMVPSDQIADKFARDGGPALRDCKCAVSVDELANVYAAVIGTKYVAGRSVTLGSAGVVVRGGRSATFADVARQLADVRADSEVAVEVDR